MPATPQTHLHESGASRLGCLLIHGYGGSPFDVEGLAAALDKEGFFTRLVTLPGHGKEYGDFGQYGFFDWLVHVEKEYAAFAERHSRVALIGFSMGGTLALNLASRFPVAGIVTISSPLFTLGLFPWPLDNLRFYAGTGKSLVLRLLNLPRAEVSHDGETSRDIAPWHGYHGPLHWRQLFSLRKGCATTRALMSRITAPLLAIQDARDGLVNPNNLWEIARRVSSVDTSVILTRMRENVSRHHMVPTHRETAQQTAAAVIRFCREKTLDFAPRQGV